MTTVEVGASLEETMDDALLPKLPDELSLRILAKISHGYHGLLECVSKRWRNAVRGSEYSGLKAKEGWSGDWLIVLTSHQTEWNAYDPEANRWHPLPKIPRVDSDDTHYGFACVTVHNKFLVIGGRYGCRGPDNLPGEVTNEVLEFDPCKKQWRNLASMRTPRHSFACAVVSGEVYVAGGRNSNSDYLTNAEVYDPLKNRWEDLPPITIGIILDGISYEGRFYVLGQLEDTFCLVFDPSKRLWQTVERSLSPWPGVGFLVVSQGSRLYANIREWWDANEWWDGNEWWVANLVIKTKDKNQRQWQDLGSHPRVVFPDQNLVWQASAHDLLVLGRDLYMVVGYVALPNEYEQEMVRLDSVRVCDPTALPLEWRETRPMPGSAALVLGCAALKE